MEVFDSMPGGYDTGGLFSESDITVDDFELLVDDIVGGRNLSFHLALPPYIDLSSNGKLSTIKDEWKIEDEFNFVHILDLDGKNFEHVWKKDYKKNKRRSIRKAIKSGVEVRDGTSLDDYRAFYDIYGKAWQKRGKNPPIPFDYFYNFYKYGSDHVKFRLATKDDKIVAGRIEFWYSKTVYGFISAFLKEYGTFNPQSLLISKSIEQACQENYKYYNLGPSGNLMNIVKFKEAFGAKKVEVNRYVVYSNLAKIVNEISNLRS
jgi:lipid II:glycine glycyltransferase (peptidoglycan interpeptide bridge formation enzyme)